MTLDSPFKKGDTVHFTCPDNGHVKGQIKRLAKCITNGQACAEIETRAQGWEEPKLFVQPLLNLRLI
jgi:hypothetical protein